jgi:DNA-binding beta-propeller fold protein YncE
MSPCSAVVPVDLKTQTAEAAISGTQGSAFAVSPTGKYLYARTPNGVGVFDLVTRKRTGTIPVGADSIAFSPDGGRAYIAGVPNNATGVAVVDTSTLALTDIIPGPGFAIGGESIAVSEDGAFVYIADYYGGAVTVLDTRSLKIVGQLFSGVPFVVH